MGLTGFPCLKCFCLLFRPREQSYSSAGNWNNSCEVRWGTDSPGSRGLPSPSKEVLLYVSWHPNHRCTHRPSCWTAFSAYREGPGKPEQLPALCRQHKGEGPLNIKIILNRESERGSADLLWELPHGPSGQEAEGLTQPSSHGCSKASAAPLTDIVFTQHQQHSGLCPTLTFSLLLTLLLPFSLLSSPSLPECNWNEASGAPISELALSLWAVKTDNAWLCL